MASLAISSLWFAPGQQVPVSGIYRVLHRDHRSEHRVFAIAGEVFPHCRKCKADVRFQLWIDVEYAARDWDFAGPDLSLLE
jgi:hypothetical protein